MIMTSLLWNFINLICIFINNCVQSNTDPTPQDLLECACKSTNPLLQIEIQEFMTLQESSQQSNSSRNAMSSKRTVLAKFRSQLNELMGYIEQTSIRYIRCIKPNYDMKPSITNHRLVMNQLESAGLVTAITISRETFPNRLKYDIIWERFLCLYNPGEMTKMNRLFSISHSFSFSEDQLKENVRKMLSTLLTTPFIRVDGSRVPSFSCGKTKVYFRTGALEHLESERMDFYSIRAEIIQAWFRSQSARRKYQTIREQIILIQAQVRGVIARKRYLQAKASVLMIQSKYRGFVERSKYLKICQSVLLIQTWLRCQAAQKRYNDSRKHIIKSQARIKRFITRRAYVRSITSIITLQSLIRAFNAQNRYNHTRMHVIRSQARAKRLIARIAYLRLVASVIKIQAVCRGFSERKNYTKSKESVDVILLWYRWHKARIFYVNFKSAMICLQARYRGAKARQLYRRLLRSVVVIQSSFRMAVPRMEYLLERELRDQEDFDNK